MQVSGEGHASYSARQRQIARHTRLSSSTPTWPPAGPALSRRPPQPAHPAPLRWRCPSTGGCWACTKHSSSAEGRGLWVLPKCVYRAGRSTDYKVGAVVCSPAAPCQTILRFLVHRGAPAGAGRGRLCRRCLLAGPWIAGPDSCDTLKAGLPGRLRCRGQPACASLRHAFENQTVAATGSAVCCRGQ